MKRRALALIVRPYKNTLLPREQLRKSLSAFATRLLDLLAAFPNLRLSLAIPGFMLEQMDSLLLSQLRDIHKRGDLEWLLTGFTEPFVSFSPSWLFEANIKAGLKVYSELAGTRPAGFAPAFSNWEPSSLPMLRECGIQSLILSRALLPPSYRDCCGYWITEYCGASIPLFPAHIVHPGTAPERPASWLSNLGVSTPELADCGVLTLEYLVPLVNDDLPDPFEWLRTLAESIEEVLLKFQLCALSEVPALAYPLGMQYVPSSMLLKREEDEVVHDFQNYLFRFDQIGILQRKLLAASEHVRARGQSREMEPLIRDLFFAQDINRYLPHPEGGFADLTDRSWTYARLIGIETQLLRKQKKGGGQIQIADYLRNGTKSIVLSNNRLKAFIDHHNGGQLFELDLRLQKQNLFAAYNPGPHPLPRILVPGKSCTSFVDHFVANDCEPASFMEGEYVELGDFVKSNFDYSIKKAGQDVKVVLRRQGSIADDGRVYPLVVEKVFGLKEESTELSFAYQLGNHSLTTYGFRLAIELHLALPGVLTDDAFVSCKPMKLKKGLTEPVVLDGITQWSFHDSVVGLTVSFVTQKPVSIWCFPGKERDTGRYQSTQMIITASGALEENGKWSLVGKMACRRTRRKKDHADAL